jgi:hypothetical protein
VGLAPIEELPCVRRGAAGEEESMVQHGAFRVSFLNIIGWNVAIEALDFLFVNILFHFWQAEVAAHAVTRGRAREKRRAWA